MINIFIKEKCPAERWDFFLWEKCGAVLFDIDRGKSVVLLLRQVKLKNHSKPK